MDQCFTLILLLISLLRINAIDYCSREICERSQYSIHVNCHPLQGFASKCNGTGKIIQFSQADKRFLLELHNKKRDFVASGQVKGESGGIFPKACNMATIIWDEELEHLARLNVLKCAMEHDCHNTQKFPTSGQNLGLRASTAGLEKMPTLEGIFNGWYNELKYVTPQILASFKSSPIGYLQYGHFTALMTENNIAMGCAASNYTGIFPTFTGNTILLACNYAAANIIGRPTYTSCAKAGEKCTKMNPVFKNLCATQKKAVAPISFPTAAPTKRPHLPVNPGLNGWKSTEPPQSPENHGFNRWKPFRILNLLRRRYHLHLRNYYHK